MRQSIRKLVTLLLLFTCSIGAWADDTQEDDGLELKHAFGEKATVTFYLFPQRIRQDDEAKKEPTASDINSFTAAVTSISEMRDYIVAHVVPAAGNWTNATMLYAGLVANKFTRAADVNGPIKVECIQLDEGRYDGAGWYYYEFPEEGITGSPIYESLLLDGYVLPKFDLSSDALKSNDGKSFTFTVENNWITDLSIDVALTDETEFYYNGSSQGPTKLTNTSIVVKRYNATSNAYDEVVTIGSSDIAKHVTSSLIAKTGYSLTEDKAVDAGDYALKLSAVTASQSSEGTNGNDPVATGIFINSKDVDFTIKPKKVEIVPMVKNKVYDGKTDAEIASATIATGIDGEALKYVSGLTAGFEDAKVGTGKILEITGTPTVEKDNEKTKVSNYDFSIAEDVKADITPKTLNIKADAKTKVYGEADPKFTYTSEGLVGNDAITGALARAEGENVGEYAITQGTLTAGNNYTIAFTGAKLTITAKTIKDNPDSQKGEGTITIELSPTEYTYDKTEKKPTVTVKDGSKTVAASEYNVAYKDNVNAGTATVTITDNEGGNYTVSGTKTFTIKPASLTIKADAKTKKVGEKDPDLTYTTEGLLKDDKLEGTLTRAEGESVGTYAITQGTLKASGNYTVTFVGANLTITSVETYYNIIVSNTSGGEVTTTLTSAMAGQQVNIIIKPEVGYHLASLVVNKKSGGDVQHGVTIDNQNNVFNFFLMPADDAIVTAVFAKNEGEQNIFIFKTKYGEVISNLLYAEENQQVNLETRVVEGYEDCVLDGLYVFNDKGEILPTTIIEDPKEGPVHFFIMKGEKAYVYPTFKGTNGIVDESQPVPPDNVLYLLSNEYMSLLNIGAGVNGVQLAMSLVANILAEFTPEGELSVKMGEDLPIALLNLKAGWQIKIDFTGAALKFLNSSMVEGLVGPDGTISSGVFYKLLTDGTLNMLLQTGMMPMVIQSITIIAPEPGPDDPTAINGLKTDDAGVRIYDLRGRKVDSTNLRKGVYIKNGKKVIIK